MMFVAKATALRSCDLSRQVGAVIVDPNGTIVSTGCNEVPMPKGGFFMKVEKTLLVITETRWSSTTPTFMKLKGQLVS